MCYRFSPLSDTLFLALLRSQTRSTCSLMRDFSIPEFSNLIDSGIRTFTSCPFRRPRNDTGLDRGNKQVEAKVTYSFAQYKE